MACTGSSGVKGPFGEALSVGRGVHDVAGMLGLGAGESSSHSRAPSACALRRQRAPPVFFPHLTSCQTSPATGRW